MTPFLDFIWYNICDPIGTISDREVGERGGQMVCKSERALNALFISTFPPRKCGIATFTQHLIEALDDVDPTVHSAVLAIDDQPRYAYGPQVVSHIQQRRFPDYGAAATWINDEPFDVVHIEHEFGIFGGDDGEYLLTLTDRLRKPYLITLHTVLRCPDARKRRLTRALAQGAAAVVVLADKAVSILSDVYDIDPAKIVHIPHGAPSCGRLSRAHIRSQLGIEGRQVLCTLGLINPGKGIENVIAALPQVAARHPSVLYLVLGQTHPGVRALMGESYRESLAALVQRLGVEEHVRFVDAYLSDEDLVNYLVASDIYITPYLDAEQISSGTLAYAAGLGKAVISTPYQYATELLDDGRGILVPFRDPVALAQAIDGVLSSPRRRRGMERRMARVGNKMHWPVVARRHAQLLRTAATDAVGVRSGGEGTELVAATKARTSAAHE